MKKTFILGLVFIFILNIFIPTNGVLPVYSEESTEDALDEFYESSYYEYLTGNGYNGQMASSEVSVNMRALKASEDMQVNYASDGIVTGDRGAVTWQFDVPEAGFYNIEVSYYPVKGTNSNIQRKIYIDDEILFKGMEQVNFNRLWNNSADGTIASKNGNEIRPSAVESPEWIKVFISDSQRRSNEPYRFYFSEGKHSITFESVKEPLKIGSIVLKAAPKVLPYKEVIQALNGKYPVYNGENILYQAERKDGNTIAIRKSSPTIGVTSDYSSPNTVPYHPYKIMLNTIGGDNWKIVGDTVYWDIEVPEEGLYQISFRARQNKNRGVKSFRTLRINGEVPFKEAYNIGFEFSGQFQNYVCSDGEEPYLFYFKKGKNTLSLEAVLGDFGMALTEVEQSVLVLNDLYRKTVQIIGLVPDKFIDYEIEKKIPDFSKIMKEQSERLYKVVDNLVEITGEKGEKAVTIEKMAIQAENLSMNPENVVNEITTLKGNISALGTWIISISEMPLEIDSFTLSAPNARLKKAEPNILVKIYYELVRFLATFFVDETKIVSDGKIDKNALKVWVSTGRDQAQIIRNLIDDSYTPKSGIPINLQLIPADVILPATLAGNGPDVVLNMGQSTVLNFAMRNALYNLASFEDFAEVKSNFYESAFKPVTHQGGIYGLPEQQSFMMLFYRNDILDQLGLRPPKTWEEVEEVISVLHINNYDFYIPEASIYPSLVYQYGSDMYKGEGNDYGIASGLDEEGAMIAFKKMTEFFTSYKLPVRVDFSNRFRTGEIPIGIAPYTTYNQLEIFAPEIRGLWSFAPIPGVKNEDGSVNNTVVADTVHCILLNSAKDKESAWDFMKWWISADTQVNYANTLEAIMGSGARYATANKEVLKQLPWSSKHAEQLLLQLEDTEGVPEVPGGYMTSRMIDYAYKAVVTSGQNPREALYLNIKEINKELTKKRKEFHLSY